MVSRRARGVAAALATVIAVAFGALPIWAATAASALAQQSVGAAMWAAVPAATTSAPGATGSMSFAFGIGAGPRYLSVTNTGTTVLSQSRYAVQYTVTATGLAIGYVALSACVGSGAAWNETTNVCVVGTVQQLTTSQSSGTVSAIVPAPAGSAIRLRAATVGVSVAVPVTISVAVTCC